MSRYHVCPRCSHDPKGFSSSWMWIYRCQECSTLFCFKCSGSNGGKKCPDCGSNKVEQHEECHTSG